MDTKLKNISAPTLSSGNYGRGVQEQFSNIDKNFKILGNYDFVKGENGAGYNFDLVTLTSDLPGEEPNTEWSASWVNYKIKTAILTKINNESDEEKLKCLSTLEGQQVMVYYLSNETPQYVGIQPFPFYDGRLLKLQALEENESFTDCSGVVCTDFENDEVVFKIFAGFPTIYYDQSVEDFCWMIGEQKTGLPACGPQGPQGSNGYILLVTYQQTETPSEDAPITNIMIGGEWVESTAAAAQEILKEIHKNSNDLTTMAYAVNYSNLQVTGPIFLSNVIVRDTTSNHATIYTGFVKTIFPFDFAVDATWFQNLKYDSDVSYNRGIFVPYVPGMNGDNNQGVHMIYAEPTASSPVNKKLIITPTTDIDNISMPDSEAELELQYPDVTMKSSSASVNTIFNNLYVNRDGVVGGEKRFTYIWKSGNKDSSSSYPKIGNSDLRPDFSEYSNNKFESFMCPDGFLWYRDPYTYLRIELRKGKVMIVGPNNGEVSVGAKSVTPENPTMSANQTSVNVIIGADSYWKIETV